MEATQRSKSSNSSNTDSCRSQAPRVQAILAGIGCPRPACSQCRVRERDIPTDSHTAAKMHRCSRCKVAHYCSPSCQKKHYGFHKKHCKYVYEQLQHLEELEAVHSASTDTTLASTVATRVATALTDLGDHLVETGYRETDTIGNGGPYYRQALQHYCQVQHYCQGRFFHPCHNAVEDKILLLLAIMGGSAPTIQEWCQHSGSPRLAYYYTSRNDNHRDPTKDEATTAAISTDIAIMTRGVATGGDMCFHMMHLLVWMRRLLEYRATLHAFQTFQDSVGGPPTSSSSSSPSPMEQANTDTYSCPGENARPLPQPPEAARARIRSFLVGRGSDNVDCNNQHLNNNNTHTNDDEALRLVEIIRKMVHAIRDHGKGRYLVALRDKIPLQPCDAPDLFRCAPYNAFCHDDDDDQGDGHDNNNNHGDDDVEDGEMPRNTLREFWFLFQDCFFLTPGLNDVLHEFVPEEEDDDADDGCYS